MIFKDKNVIVTGSNRGIGRAIVAMFASEGANIWACARKQSVEFESDIDSLSQKFNVQILPVYFDVRNEDEMKEAVASILRERRSIDVLVNNAGMTFNGLIGMTPQSKLQEIFEVNFFAAIRMMQLVSKQMIRQKYGSIVNIGSAGGIEANPGYLAYGSSKAALMWASRCAAKEFGPYNVRVNVVAPGLIDTQMISYKTEEVKNEVIARTPLGRLGHVDEVADAVRYLASAQSSFVTGQILVVGGGAW